MKKIAIIALVIAALYFLLRKKAAPAAAPAPAETESRPVDPISSVQVGEMIPTGPIQLNF